MATIKEINTYRFTSENGIMFRTCIDANRNKVRIAGSYNDTLFDIFLSKVDAQKLANLINIQLPNLEKEGVKVNE